MKNKKILIIPIILIILLVLGAGASAIIYFQTDLFKSPKQLFFKYLGDSIDFDKEFDYDKFLAEYKEKTEYSYTANGEITTSLDYTPSENNSANLTGSSTTKISNSAKDTITNLKDSLNNAKIQYSAESIPTKQKYHMSIKPIYNDTEITNLELLSSGENYGIKCTDLYDKYIYIENNNLKSLASKFGLNSSMLNMIPDKIQKTDPYELLFIAPETRKQISEKYTKLLDNKLTKDMFSKQKNISTSVNGENVKTNSYTLTINGEQAYDILLSFLQELKEDDVTLDLLIQKMEQSGIKESFENGYNGYSSRSSLTTYNSNSTKKSNITLDKDYLKDMIQEAIDDLKEDKSSFSADDKISFTAHSHKNKFVKLEITNSEDTDKMSIEITNNKKDKLITLNHKDTTILKANYSVAKDKTNLVLNVYDDSDEIFVITAEYGKNNTKLNFKTESDDTSIEMNTETNGEIGKGTVNTTGYLNIQTDDTKLQLNINQNTNYTDNVNIDDLTANNGELLNQMSNTKMNSLVKEISDNFQKVLPEKAKILGIEIPDNTTNNNGGDNNIINQKDLTGYTVYTHSSGVQFAYPETWKSLSTSSSKPVFSNSENGTNVNLLSETVPTGYDLKSYMNASISNVKTQMSNKLDGDIENQYVKLNGKDASIITYILTQNNTKVRIKQVCFIDDNTAYILTTAALEDNYSQDSEIINNIISSFKK